MYKGERGEVAIQSNASIRSTLRATVFKGFIEMSISKMHKATSCSLPPVNAQKCQIWTDLKDKGGKALLYTCIPLTQC